VCIVADSITNLLDAKPYHGENWMMLGYPLPHFTFGIVLFEFFIDHGLPTLVYRVIMPLRIGPVWTANCLTIVIYLGLYIYLDAIIPNKYGIAQSCCFCLKGKGKKIKKLKDKICGSKED
jgi:hypothetical protein